MAEPIVWLLLGRKAGDNTQVRALAVELGWACEEKHIVAQPWELLPHLLLGSTLAGISLNQSATLAAPWPDLVITAGRRNEPVARWIQQRSGGATKLVHLGRPWANPENYDLVITTPQYFLPVADNIHYNKLPLYRLDKGELELAGQALREKLTKLQRPYLGVMVGGNSGRFVFTRDKGRQLGQAANQLAEELGGAILLTDSPRTPRRSFDALLAELTVEHYCYRWGEGNEENPYRGYLALADQLVVTGESMSMLAEASGTGKPLHIFDMGDGGVPWWRQLHSYRYKPLSDRLAMALGSERMRRDVSRIQRALVDAGQAVWLGQAYPESAEIAPQQSDAVQELEASAKRVRDLLAVSAAG